MRSRFVSVLPIACALVLGSACESPFEKDLVAFCAIAHDVQADADAAPPVKVARLQQRAAAELHTPELARLSKSIAAAPADERYALLMAAAKKEGMRMWSCFDGRNLWKELGEHERLAAFDAAHPEAAALAKRETAPASKKSKGKKKRKKKRGKKKRRR